MQTLDKSVEFYFRSGLAGSTQKAYASAKRQFSLFSLANGLNLLPASEHTLCRFISSLANENLCHNTIKSYLAGIRHLHIDGGFGDPRICDMAWLEQVLRGIKLSQAKGVQKQLVRLPITPDLLFELKSVWVGKTAYWDGYMLWAAAALCFFGFLRSGEITIPSDTCFDEGAHLSFKDVAVDSLLIRVRLKASKTDPFRKGVDVFVGITNHTLGPVSAIWQQEALTRVPSFVLRMGDLLRGCVLFPE